MKFDQDTLDPKQTQIFHAILGLTVSIGFIMNLILLIILIMQGLPSRLTTILLRSQSFIDCTVCLITLLLNIFPDFTSTNIYYLDIFICHAWQGQAIFWWFVLAGVFNLIFTAVDRYWAIITPQKYKNQLTKKIIIMMVAIYLGSGIITCPAFLQTSLVNKTCLSQYAFGGEVVNNFFKAFSIIWFLSVYGIPSVVMIYLYTKIIFQLGKTFDKSQSSKAKSASRTLTNATIVITIIFILTVSFDAFYYMLGYWKLVNYVFNAPLQLVGVFLTAFNSSMNSIVLFVMVKSLRQKIGNLLRIILRKKPTAIDPSISDL